MPGCDTGRNVQKYRGGGGGASTLQEALENGNISTLAIELQSSGVFIGDGGGLSNIAGVGGSVGNMQQVTTSGASTSNKIILTNTNESLQASGNVTVNSGKFFLGDGGLLSNTAGTVTLQQASNQGNVINNTISFTNAAESIVTTGKIVVGTSLEATNVIGNGSGLSSINASNVSTGTLSISQGGTGATTLNNLIEMGTHTSGDFVGTISGGNGIASTAGTSGEDTDHILSVDLKSNGGLEFDSGELALDIKSTGGLELDSGELALDIKANHGLALDTNELKIDLKSQGGLEFDSGKLGIDVKSTGGLELNNGELALDIKANHGLALDTNELKIDLKSQGGLEFDSGKLGIDVKSTGGLELDSGELALDIKANHGLALDTNELKIDLKSQGGLEFDSGKLGIDVKSTGGLELDSGELALDIKANHGLALDTNELKIDLKSQGGLEFDSGKLGIDVKSTGGLELNNGELALDIKANHGLALDTNELKIDLKSQGGLEFDSGQLGVDVKANHGLAIDTNELKIDLKSGGGLEFDNNDSYKMRVKLDDANTSGKLPVNKGGTANDTFTGGGVLYYDSSNTKFVSTGAGQNGQVLKIVSGVPDWGSDNVSGNSGVGSLSQVTAVGSTTATKITLTNTNVSLETSGNVVVGNNKFFKGDAGLLSNIATSSTTITGTSTSEGDIMFTTGSNTLNKDSNQRIKYDPTTSTLTIKDSQNRSNTLTSLTWSGQANKVFVDTDISGTARSLAFVDGDSIFKDGNDNLAWTPSSKSLRLGPSGGTSNTLTNVLWSGKSSKIAIGNSDTSGDARPVLYGIGEIANKDTSDRLNWTPGGTHAGTLTIGTIGGGGTHSNITSTTFTGTATKVTVNNDNNDTNTNTLAIPYVNGTDLDSKAGTFHYTPNTDTVSAAIFSGTATNVTVNNDNNDTNTNTLAIPYVNGADLDSKAGTFHYKPDDGTLTATTFNGALTGTATKVTVNNDNSDVNASTLAIPYVNSTDLDSKAGTFHYQPSTGTVSATKFSGNGSGLTHLNFEESNNSGEVPVGHGGTGFGSYDIGNMLYAGTTTSFTKIGPPGGNNETKFLKYVTDGSGNLSSIGWGTPSVSGISITDDTSSATGQGITFAAGDGAQTIKSDQSTLHYKPSTGTLTTSKLITSDTSTNARNGISNGNPTHTLSVGTVVSIQETSTGDVLIVRGNGYFNDDVYIAKRLTVPVGGEIKADTIKVRSLSQKGTLVVAERLVDTILAGSS